MTDDGWRGWLADFERTHGRPLRVLHIGNIANNAYINAKVQRRHGIEADVVSYDYFHVMGCPEWEDAAFTGDVGDPFFPDWWSVDLHGFERPRWFAQGRRETCVRYLVAVRRGHRLRAALLWRRLRFEVWLRCRRSRPADLVRRLAGATQGLRGRRLTAFQAPAVLGHAAFLRRTARRKALLALRAVPVVLRGGDWRTAALTVLPRRLGGLARTPEQRRLVEEAWAATIVLSPEAAPAPDPAGASDASAVFAASAAPAAPAPAPDPDPAPPAGSARAARATADALAAYVQLFPDRPPLTAAELAGYAAATDCWAPLLGEYDVIQGYATDPIIPLLCGVRAYAGYEHGTLRTLPFVDDDLGKTLSLSYRSAPVVFVTNLDVVPVTGRLGIARERVVCLPHATDDAPLAALALEQAGLRPAGGAPVTLFAPARHDWVDADPTSAKSNDRFLHGLRQAREAGHDCRVVFVEFGRDVDATKRLVTELGLDAAVSWLPLLDKRELRERFLSSHAVVDQFTVPAFGSVTFEALALGVRVITALDRALAADFFGEAPPLLAAQTVGEIAAAIAQVAADPLDREGRGPAAAAWFREHHSSERIVELQADAYRRLLAPTRVREPRGPADRSGYRCPTCQGTLEWTDEAGTCAGCGARWPVVAGVPRFVAVPEHGGIAQIQGVFDFEHRRHERSKWTLFERARVDEFLRECGLEPEFFAGKRALDAGCGSGRWSYALAELGADVTGVDLTAGGVEISDAELGGRPNARFAQANLFALPFAPGSFDFVMSWGVLHHTPTTKGAFECVAPLVAPGGTLYVMVYERVSRKLELGTNALRFLMRRFPAERRYALCGLLVLRSRLALRLLAPWFMIAYLDPASPAADAEAARFGLYDAYSPRYNFVHTTTEVEAWFREAGFVDVTAVEVSRGAVRMRGVRPTTG